MAAVQRRGLIDIIINNNKNRDLRLGPQEYKAVMLTCQPRRSIKQ
jgi:hypothetical protein